MRLNAPTKSTTFVSVILALVALVAYLIPRIGVNLPAIITGNIFWILFIGFCLLLAGCIFKKF